MNKMRSFLLATALLALATGSATATESVYSKDKLTFIYSWHYGFVVYGYYRDDAFRIMYNFGICEVVAGVVEAMGREKLKSGGIEKVLAVMTIDSKRYKELPEKIRMMVDQERVFIDTGSVITRDDLISHRAEHAFKRCATELNVPIQTELPSKEKLDPQIGPEVPV